MPPAVEALAGQLLVDLAGIGRRAIAHGVRSVATDVRGYVDEAQRRLNVFVAGCEEVAKRGAREDEEGKPVAAPIDRETSRQTPRAKKRRR